MLERKLHGKLKLTRIEHCSRLSEGRIRSPRDRYRQKSVSQPDRRWRCRAGHGACAALNGHRCRVSIVLWNVSTEDRRAVDGIHFVHVRPVEHVECIDRKIHPHALGKLEISRNTQIPGIQCIANVGVPSDGRGAIGDGRAGALDGRAADAVRAQAGHVTKGVLSGEQGEGPAGLQSHNAAELEIPHKTVLGSLRRKVDNKLLRMSWFELARSDA